MKNGSTMSLHDEPPLTRLRVALELEMPSDVRYIERIVGLVMHHCSEVAFPRQKCTLNVPVALSEALSNAIPRGNREDPSKDVRVRACRDERGLIVEVADQGSGFDMQRCMRDPTRPENVAREDGRGLYLMHRLMDRVEHFTDQWNVVRLTLSR